MKRYLFSALCASSLLFAACESSNIDDNGGAAEEKKDFSKLSHYDSDSYPTTNKWTIKDESATKDDFEPLAKAITAASEEGRSIEIILSNMTEIPAEALTSADLTALSSIECSVATTVKERAFKNAKELKTVELPAAKIIEDGAFDNCENLSSITLYSTESIDGFAGCVRLSRVVAPKLKSIEKEAFKGDVMLTAISFDSAESIESEAFSGCENLSIIELPAATSFQSAVFAGCRNIEEFTIAQEGKLTHFSDDSGDMFEGVDELLAVAFSIGSENESLLDIENGSLDATSIGGAIYGPFKSVNSVTPTVSSISLSKLSAQRYPLDANIWNIIDSEATSDDFDGLCDAIEEVSDAGGREITLHFENLAALPDYALEAYKDYNVRDFSALKRVELPVATSIGQGAFKHCEDMTSIDMPAMKIIGVSAFSECYKLESAATPNVTTVGSYAFSDCISLKALDFPKATDIGDAAFRSCRDALSASFPLITSTSYKMFSACVSLITYELPLVTYVDILSFDSCFSLETVSLPDVTELASSAFINCTSLTSVNLPKATAIGNMSFQNCTSLKEISLPTAQVLDGATFRGCTALTTVSLPEVTAMGDSAQNAVAYGDFESCTSLVDITLPKVVDVGSSSFYLCGALERVSLPKGERFGNNVFAACEKLTYLNIAEKCEVEYFGDANADVFAEGAILEDVDLRIGFANKSMTNKGTRLFLAPVGGELPISYGPFKSIELANEVVGKYSKLSDYSQADFPSDSEWIVDDVEATAEDFAGLHAALASLDGTKDHITLKFANMLSIPDEALDNLPAISSIEIPVATTIGNSAFEGATGLSQITAPKVVSLGDNALAACSMLMNLSLPEATTLGEGTLSGCSYICSLDLPAVENIGAHAFEGIGGSTLATITVATESTLLSFGDSDADLFTADNCSKISIIIGSYNSALYDTTTNMFDAASIGGASYGPFAKITEQAQIVDYTELKHYSATSYPKSSKWTIEQATATYEEFEGLREALASLSQFKTITLVFTQLEELPANALYDDELTFPALYGIELHEATAVGDNALRNCAKLEKITMPKVETLGSYSISGCPKLYYDINLPALKTIGDGAFSGDTNVMYFTIPNVTSVGNRAFEGLPYIMTLKMGFYSPITHFGDVDGYVFGENPTITWATVTLGSCNEELLNREEKKIDASSIGGDVYGPFNAVNTSAN